MPTKDTREHYTQSYRKRYPGNLIFNSELRSNVFMFDL